MELRSAAFEHGGRIPFRYTCDGANVSPPLEISDVPETAAALALVMDDPDAPGGTFDHWLVWNIPPDTTSIPEDSEPEGVQGKTDFGRRGYGGPCPPDGTHTYRFKLYALDQELSLPQGARKSALEEAMTGHVLAQTLLAGVYTRNR
ncbi:MAG: YbhB/YbcL family Raf kinase inhibitor-like protein [Planctomycetes bacterium]|nr:YbhB/YbcL family Raf kinase inhibitor-like protein [Planctomycetota bacterium]